MAASRLLRVTAVVWGAVALVGLLIPRLAGEYLNLFQPTTTAVIFTRGLLGGVPLGLALTFWRTESVEARDAGLALSVRVHLALVAAMVLGIVVAGRAIPRLVVVIAAALVLAGGAAWARRDSDRRGASSPPGWASTSPGS